MAVPLWRQPPPEGVRRWYRQTAPGRYNYREWDEAAQTMWILDRRGRRTALLNSYVTHSPADMERAVMTGIGWREILPLHERVRDGL